MKTYELMAIFKPNLDAEEVDKAIEALGKTVSEKEISEFTCLEEASVSFIILKLQYLIANAHLKLRWALFFAQKETFKIIFEFHEITS